MPLFNSQNQNARSGRQLGIVAMALLQLLVLFAIGAAVIRYLEWSSDAARAEFTRAIEAVSDHFSPANLQFRIRPPRSEPVATGTVELMGPRGLLILAPTAVGGLRWLLLAEAAHSAKVKRRNEDLVSSRAAQ
jgi:hypothetical protein